MSRYVVALIVERDDGEDHPADWAWSDLLDCRAEHVTSTPLTAQPVRVQVGDMDDVVWLEVSGDEVVW